MQLKPAVTALVTAVALASLLSGCKKEEAAPPAQTPQVGVVTIQPQAYTLTTELPGRTTAFRIAEVRPQVNGIILKRLFKEGADVKEGQQLYQIDPSVYEATLKSAQASLTQTKSISDRYKQLVDEQAVSSLARPHEDVPERQFEVVQHARIERPARVLPAIRQGDPEALRRQPQPQLEALPRCCPDTLEHLVNHAEPVAQRSPVGIGAVVARGVEELSEQIAVRAVHLHPIEAGPFGPHRG